MEYIHNTEQFQFHNTVVALGKFDGMHKGHQLIFDELLKYKEMGYQAAVFSFDRPPLNMLKHKHMSVIYTCLLYTSSGTFLLLGIKRRAWPCDR